MNITKPYLITITGYFPEIEINSYNVSIRCDLTVTVSKVEIIKI